MMHHVPQAGLTLPAVAGRRLERGVRPHSGFTLELRALQSPVAPAGSPQTFPATRRRLWAYGLEGAAAQALDEAEPTCVRRPDKLTERLNLRGVTSLRDAAGAPDHFDFEAPNCGRRSKTWCQCPRLSRTPGRWPSFVALPRSWLFDSRRMAHFLLKSPRRQVLRPNVRAKADRGGRRCKPGQR
jgi:hypothetical protein